MNTEYQIRPAIFDDASGIAQVQVASWKTTYRGILPDALIDRIGVEDRTKSWQKILTTFDETGQGGAMVVETAGRIVGFGSYGQQRDAELAAAGFGGEFTTIYLEHAHQRAGLGRALMAAMAAELVKSGETAAALWVISANTNAVAFYRALAGETVAERADPQGGDMDECAYGWRDLSGLIG
ncbi:GNAT family N-acetyltransferase [Thalassovita gelatinovora]|nr:GNAT family N-acetyltransferase [Thalassovita gelatinovora]QIZ82143.1 GNAT family N-acetyltransferase [Thalassovita gelatinovora]